MPMEKLNFVLSALSKVRNNEIRKERSEKIWNKFDKKVTS